MTDETIIEELIYQALNESTDPRLEDYELFYLGDRSIQDAENAILIYELPPDKTSPTFDDEIYNPVYALDIILIETLDYVEAQKELKGVAYSILKVLHQSQILEDYHDIMTIKNNLPVYEEGSFILKSRRVEVSFLEEINYYGDEDDFEDIGINGEFL